MALRPWSKFYWSDWRADPRLRMCSLAARGLWVELCGLAHEAEPYGHVLVAGRVPSPEQLASLVGAPLKAVLAALKELDAAEVFSRTDAGVIYSRRMVRDREREEKDKANGKGGGNPHLKAKHNGGVNPPDKPPDKAQKREARSQNETPNGVSPAQPADEESDGRKARRKPQREIPADWRPSAEGMEFARSNGFGFAETERIIQRFRDHWISKAERRANWDASWRTWIGNEVKFAGQRGNATPKLDPADQRDLDRRGILAALAPGLPVRHQ